MTSNKELLKWFGDQLDLTDDVKEKNGVGFNLIDKGRWPHIRNNETKELKLFLQKYRNQLIARFGEEQVNSIVWSEVQDDKILASVAVTIEDRGYGLKLNSNGRLEKNRFNAFIDYVKSKKARCDVGRGYLWVVGFDFNFEAFKTHLLNFEIEIEEIPVVEIKPRRDVVVKKNEEGVYEVYHDYSEVLNSAYRNAEETSSIFGFDWTKKCRLISKDQLSDLDEILEVIKKNYPQWEVHFDFNVNEERVRVETLRKELRQSDASLLNLLNEGFSPLPYQFEGYRYYEQFKGCALNGDDMGLGKTLQTLLYAAKNNKKTLVICPKNVRRQWLQEASKFFKKDIFNTLELNSKSKVKSLEGYNLVTLNYEILAKHIELLENSGFDLLVLDESHRIKNPSAKTTKLVLSLSGKFLNRICLSGTPIKNKKREIFTQANFISPETFKSEYEVLMGTNFQTREKLKQIFFRRTKKQELKDLPEKFRSIISIEAKTKLPDVSPDFQIGDISRLKSTLAQAKTPYTKEFVEDILENTDSKVIVFSDSDDAACALHVYFGKLSVLHIGATSHEKREQAKEVFNNENSEVRVFIATTGSAREGLNLTVADKVVFNDLPWTPADLNQAEARAHRLGQKNCVNVYWMQAEGNEFDRRSVEILTEKMKIYEALINGKKLTQQEQQVLKQGVADILVR